MECEKGLWNAYPSRGAIHADENLLLNRFAEVNELIGCANLIGMKSETPALGIIVQPLFPAGYSNSSPDLSPPLSGTILVIPPA